MSRSLIASLIAALCCTPACSKKDPAPAGTPGASDPDAEYRVSTRSNLQWKRYAAVEADLAQALALPKDELCNEFGLESCIRKVHLVPLGGNDPFDTGLLEASAEPLATTSSAIDRILLSACSRRVELDREAGTDAAEVFTELDLDGDAPAASAAAVRDTVTTLYRRLLARDPDAHELPIVAALVVDEDGEPVSAADFATLACYAIGTTTEFLFF